MKVAISTDAHSIDHLDYMRLGVAQARRGWLEPTDVLNTHLRSAEEIFQAVLRPSGEAVIFEVSRLP